MTATFDEARQRFTQGIVYFEAGRLKSAREAFEATLLLAPDRPSVLGNLGIILLRLRSFEDALPLLQQATVAEPDYVEAWTCLGMVLDALGRWEAAADVYETIATLLRTSVSPWLRMAACLTRLGRSQQTLRAYDHALMVAPEYAEAWTSKGGLLRELQRLDEAAQCFEKALARGGNVELNRYYLASVCGSAGSYASHASNTPSAPPRQYVEGLFDDYVQEYQQHVTGKLGFQGDTQLLEPLIAPQHRFERALDLGCGTGLCAPLLHLIAKVIDGVDLSQAMLRKAHKRGFTVEQLHRAPIREDQVQPVEGLHV